MRIEYLSRIAAVDSASWNALTLSYNPFIKHEYLSAFEAHGCVSPGSGWQPCHLVARDNDRLVGAVPLYLKSDSWGEFVFDFAWADAYRRVGKAYYPKLVAAVPYTPASGPRLLAATDTVKNALISAAHDLAKSQGASSLHWLFPLQEESALLAAQGFLIRHGCQYHWENRDYEDFDHFLATFSAEKRKKVKRERRRVQEAGIAVTVLTGHEVTPALWRVFFGFYRLTMVRKSGHAPLNLGFFQDVGRTMPDKVVMILARYHGEYVAAALSFRSDDTLYGRYWGASRDFHSLHFEMCYYAGIEYCIAHGLQRFEPGAQGEHKISRGFLPTFTYSAHWLADSRFQHAVAEYLDQEREYMRYHSEELSSHGPYKV